MKTNGSVDGSDISRQIVRMTTAEERRLEPHEASHGLAALASHLRHFIGKLLMNTGFGWNSLRI